MKTKLIRLLLPLMLLMALVLSSVTPALAAQTETTSAQSDGDNVVFTNKDTGYCAVIRDDSGLFDSADRNKLQSPMKRLTLYCNAVFFSNNTYSPSELDDITEQHLPPFNYDDLFGVVFDVKNKKLRLLATGTAEKYIGQEKSNDILEKGSEGVDTDNITGAVAMFSAAYTAMGGASAEDAATEEATPESYVNPETGYKAVILDNDMLLTEEERKSLTEDMKPLTAYGNVAFWTTREYAYDEIEQARVKRLDLFRYESAAIFVINMDIRKLTIQSYGLINQYVTDSKARSITDNVKHYATDQNYYQAAKEAYAQMLAVVQGEMIPEPMKYASYAVLALMVGLIAALAFVFSKRANPLIEDTRQIAEQEAPEKPACSDVNVNLFSVDKKTGIVAIIFKFVGRVLLEAALHGGGGGGGSSSSSGGGCGGGGSSSSGGGCGGGCGSGGSSSF